MDRNISVFCESKDWRRNQHTVTIIETFLQTRPTLLDLFGKYDKVYSHASFGVTRTLIYGVCAARKTGHNAHHAQKAR